MITIIYLLELVGIIICFVFGTVFFVLPIPKDKIFKSYQESVKFLSISYLFTAILFSFFLYFHYTNVEIEVFDFVTILISSLQAIFFTFILIKLFDYKYSFKIFLYFGIYPILFFVVIYLSALHFKTNSLFTNSFLLIIRIFFFTLYLFQIVYYTYLFVIEKDKYMTKLLNYFSETHQINLKSIHFVFYSALIISLLVLVTQIYPALEFNLFLSFAIDVFYFVFAIKYLNYNKIIRIIQPSINTESKQNTITHINEDLGKCEAEFTNKKSLQSREQICWQLNKNKIIDKKYFLIQGLTLEYLAQKLGLGRTTLSSLINNQEGESFNLFINKLRIEYSKKILLQQPEYSITQIAELCGYTEISNFSRQFKLITNSTPTFWKKMNSSNIFK